jgi:putative restriction endonuclease
VQTGRQVADQNFRGGNRALALSSLNGLPVRVIRKAGATSHSPAGDYRYDGLYLVDDYWYDTGRSGFRIWRYRLIKLPNPSHAELTVSEEQGAYSAPRQASTITRIVRDTEQARRIKALYDYECQICGIRLVGLAGPYAEAAHIRPLGAPHDGPDVSENILCLCPNHHVLFDHGGVAVGADLALIGAVRRLTVHPKHQIGAEYLRYRRKHYGAAPCSNR